MSLPPRFVDLKASIAASYPDFEKNATQSWAEILQELDKVTKQIKDEGVNYIPQVNFADLQTLSQEQLDVIKRRGSVVIKDIVPDEQAIQWKEDLKEFVTVNATVEVQARSHPNLLAASTWLNKLYHTKSDTKNAILDGVDMNVPLTYADRFRIRKPGVGWNFHPPHVDGGTIERWEDPYFRRCFEDMFTGNWKQHDPFELAGRLDARSSLYGRPNQSSIFRSFQGWLAMSETAPTQGTLKVFPDVLLSNAYLILRPFFTPTISPESDEIFDIKHWKFGPRPTPDLHPNMRLEASMTSVPKVNPGDGVFWHCDVVHAVETDHIGQGDSAVMYIPAVPLTPQNQAYVERQKAAFSQGQRPPDFPKGTGEGEAGYVGIASVDDVISKEGRRAMGLVEVGA
ncbi:hypothetical protein BJ912DRAFT_1125852 [Pholiota molesta]|nr:hypothetical protein BJ912DRAFT_1125852 [Pholiota molesta]